MSSVLVTLARTLGLSQRECWAGGRDGALRWDLGGILRGEAASLITGLIEHHGGVQGLVAQLEQRGLGGVVQSWIGNGPNQPIGPEQLHQALGSDSVTQLAQKFGGNPQDLLMEPIQRFFASRSQTSFFLYDSWVSRLPRKIQ